MLRLLLLKWEPLKIVWQRTPKQEPGSVLLTIHIFLLVTRMVDSGTVDACDVCVFELTERVGGRLFSLRGLGPDGDLTVDAGGYRTVRQQFKPLTGGLTLL